MDINQIIEQHALWLYTGGKEGSRANLTRANLTRANLYGANMTHANLTRANLDCANLDGASGNLNNLKSVFCDTYPVTYTAEVMQIGCQCHKLEDWWSFDDARIIEMEGKTALKWWRTWKPILQQIIATSPANATGYVENNTDPQASAACSGSH